MQYKKSVKEKNKIYDLIIIGGGPAGLTAAIYAKRSLLKILILEKSFLGGKLNKTGEIENYPGFALIKGPDLAEKISQQAQRYEIDWQFEEAIELEKKKDVFFVKTRKEKEFWARAVIVASGAIENKLEVKGEEEFMNKGVSCCAICDGFIFREKSVAVVGGGYSALEAALYMSNIASKVYLIHRRSDFRAEQEIVEKVQKDFKISLFNNYKVAEIRGKEKVEKIIITNLVDNKEKELLVSAVFPCIGLTPFSDFTHDSKLCDQKKYIRIKEDCSTSILGLFAAGDVARSSEKKIKQIVTAVAEGAIAAQSAIKYLKELD